MNYYLTEVSSNKKTGPIPVSTISKVTCPSACSLKNGNGCYAENFPLSGHWDKVTSGERGTDFKGFLDKVKRLPNSVWRHAQAGDLPGEDNSIDAGQLIQLADANRHRPVIAFTHKPITSENLEALREAKERGFHINLSASNMADVEPLIQTGLSVVTVLPSEYARRGKNERDKESLLDYRLRLRSLNLETSDGTKVALCPATYLDVTCQKCKACAKPRPKNTIIGFPAHGNRAKVIDKGISSENKDLPNKNNTRNGYRGSG